MIIPLIANYDRKVMVNGLKGELIMTINGHPQFHLAEEYDEYGLGPIGAYIPSDESFSINPIVEYKDRFDKLAQMNLLSAFNRI